MIRFGGTRPEPAGKYRLSVWFNPTANIQPWYKPVGLYRGWVGAFGGELRGYHILWVWKLRLTWRAAR